MELTETGGQNTTTTEATRQIEAAADYLDSLELMFQLRTSKQVNGLLGSEEYQR